MLIISQHIFLPVYFFPSLYIPIISCQWKQENKKTDRLLVAKESNTFLSGFEGLDG